MLYLEHRRALRRSVEPKSRRTLRNLGIAGISATAVQSAEMPAILPLTRLVERRRIGLLQRLPLPRAARTVAALLLMDYTLYLWHVIVHRVPWLYRFHVVHHADLDMDASTALRFHFGELLASIPWRAAQVLAFGVGERDFRLWQRALMASILFHHSNVRLPIALERRLAWLVVTPRLHGIHHSMIPEEQNSNWSSGLAIWDRLHGTLRIDLPQEALTIGVPAYRDPESVTLPRMLELPFVEKGSPWRLPEDGVPSRGALPPARALPP